MLEDLRNHRVIVGLSGGVDSAVAALLLKDAGADVQALHMTNWEDDDGYCRAAEDLQDARRVCERIGVPLHHANFARQYREQVFAHFLDEYRRGRTPNPDVLCNREIKFGAFFEHARRLGAEWIATGHYARTACEDGRPLLLKAADAGKDQTYFLHAVGAEALARTVFPIGGLHKRDVRRIARERGLPVFDKKDSTGICFIGERPFREFLAAHLSDDPGPIMSIDGREVGRHRGLAYYTLGQRQGLGIGGRRDAGEEPWYVVDKRPADNALIVDQGDSDRLLSTHLLTGVPSWIGQAPPELDAGLRCTARIRHRQEDQDCVLRRVRPQCLEVVFDAPQRAAAPGQFAVFYAGERCLGGAVIDEVRRPDSTAPAVRAAAF